MWPGISLGSVVVFSEMEAWFGGAAGVASSVVSGSGPKSGSGRETVRTSYSLSSTSVVLMSSKP